MTVEMLDRWRCQACRQSPIAEEVGDDDHQEAYRVCPDCANRLRRLALRPIEWFNLAAVHGWNKFLLHDDFYDQDGSASQPDAADYTTEGMEAPTPEMCAKSLDRLIDYCITRWRLSRPDFEAFGPFATSDILASLQERAEMGNRHVLKTALELCANVIGSSAAPWVHGQCERARRDNALFAWAEAAAKCLPSPEGLHMTIDALKSLRGRDLQNDMAALSWFRSPEVLDWIEANAPFENVSASWGQLASLSNLYWVRAQDWLAKRRPLSLVALDALACYIPHQGRAPILNRINPMLKGGVDRSAIERTLQNYASDDDASRVVARCRFIIGNLDKLHVE
ncbi:hypothetical protein FXB40_45925 [Bradyrhizobium rifense]|uniref:Uncharacterized protein n=1 Tax=Bradyrhizobium rifense TaxID=515499 RepID=A0A5D3K9Z4_9BRAD|nr:hypothetical protein [Bradyrhizobium rifense]TYL83710.1 hypothetical protein FXB40_45925 [Bradyrhizobium rifense]